MCNINYKLTKRILWYISQWKSNENTNHCGSSRKS